MGSKALTDLCRGRWQVKAPRKYGGYFRTDQEHRDFVSIGTAAGMCPVSPQTLLCCCMCHARTHTTCTGAVCMRAVSMVAKVESTPKCRRGYGICRPNWWPAAGY